MVAFIGLSTQPVYYNNRRIAGAKVYVYDAGANSPRTAYADGLANTPRDWPFETDANGCIPPFWVSGSSIKVVITTSTGTVIRTIDDIPGDTAAATVTPGTGTTIPSGFMMAANLTGAVTGWVRANGRTIGNGTSGATERANADTSDLYTALWSDTLLSVSGGRGASAAADFAASKTLTLPDYRGRAFVGLADMGNTAATTLDNVTFGSGNNTTLGSACGADVHALSEAELATHTHTGTASSGGSHTHTATQASHSHTYSEASAYALATGGASSMYGVVFGTGATSSATPTITVASGGSHTHTLSVSNTGSGTAHNNMQPSRLCTVYIKL